jgi:hypothetical protein
MPPKGPDLSVDALTAQEAAETLRWWIDAGVDLAIDEAAHDRFAEPAPKPRAKAPPAAVQPPPARMEQIAAAPDDARRSASALAAAKISTSCALCWRSSPAAA